MLNDQSIMALIQARFSCRTYRNEPIAADLRRQLEGFMDTNRVGPLGTSARFKLVAATEEDRQSLKGLGTYGFIRGATGFILGAVGEGAKNLEDFGYLMEHIVLYATSLSLGTCWLGGTFNKSGFADKLGLEADEVMAAVAAVGAISDRRGLVDRVIRRGAGSISRRPWDRLFFDRRFDAPLTPEAAGDYATPLEMVRLGPSASNRQPWRIVWDGTAWHFYIQRTPGYGKGFSGRFMTTDLQRVDLGIAMCHWALTTEELGLNGSSAVREPAIPRTDDLTEYVVSWA